MRKRPFPTFGAIFLLALSNLGCSVAERLSCGEKPQVDTTHKERLQVRLIVEQHGQTVIDEATIVCRIVGSECIEVGGDWSTKWQKIPRQPRPLTAQLPGGEVVSVKPPHFCGSLRRAAGEGDQHFQGWPYPEIQSGRLEEAVPHRLEERREILERFQIEHLGLEVNSLD